MAKRSIFRIKVEKAFDKAGIGVTSRRGAVFVDTRKSGAKRIKFSMTHLSVKQTLDVRHELRNEFTHHDFRIDDIPQNVDGWFNYHGTAVTVFY